MHSLENARKFKKTCKLFKNIAFLNNFSLVYELGKLGAIEKKRVSEMEKPIEEN